MRPWKHLLRDGSNGESRITHELDGGNAVLFGGGSIAGLHLDGGKNSHGTMLDVGGHAVDG